LGSRPKALAAIFSKCLPLGVTLLKDGDGLVQTIGVGDRSGNLKSGFSTWHGVSTINELKVKNGGVPVAVKMIKNKSAIIVGFKVGDGDKAASEALHKLFASKLHSDSQ
jgi:hypothetical protein